MEKAIKFSYADRRPVLRPVGKYKRWLLDILRRNQVDALDLRFIFCSDEYLLTINRDFLQHNYYTDIITFDLSAPNALAKTAEIYISWDRVRDNAAIVGVTSYHELRRVMAHGLLHLCGFGDKTKREKATMTDQEDACLRLWEKLPTT